MARLLPSMPPDSWSAKMARLLLGTMLCSGFDPRCLHHDHQHARSKHQRYVQHRKQFAGKRKLSIARVGLLTSDLRAISDEAGRIRPVSLPADHWRTKRPGHR